jgi:NADPH2 dehydrogenase
LFLIWPIELDRITRIGLSAIPLEGPPVIESMTVHEIRKIVQDFVKAARNAMEAELGGVELDGHNGLLHDQFVQDVTNQRDNEYGGNIDNR